MAAPKSKSTKDNDDFSVSWSVANSDADKASEIREGIPTPPQGMYKAKVADIKLGHKLEDGVIVDGSARFEVRAQLVDSGPYTGWTRTDYIPVENPATEWKLDQFLQAFGIASGKKRTGTAKKSDFLGKTAMVRIRHRSYEDADGNPQVGGEVAGWWKLDASKLREIDEEDVTAGKRPPKGKQQAVDTTAEEEPEEDVTDDAITAEDLDALGELADSYDEDADEDDENNVEASKAAAKLTELAEAAGLSINDYGPWADLAMALYPEDEETPEDDGEEDSEDSEEEDESEGSDDEELNDYNDEKVWSVADLKAELESRGLKTNGPRGALVKRLQDSDNDPFANQ
jgi:hypothetical protein